MKIKFIPIDYDYFDWNERNFIKIVGRDENNKRVCLIDEYTASFWAILKDDVSDKKIEDIRKKIEKIKADSSLRNSSVVRTELHNKKFLGKNVKAIKIFITNYKDGHAIADQIDFDEIEKRREYDINLITKYIIEKKVKPLMWYEVEGEIFDKFGSYDADICLKIERMKEIQEKEFFPKIMAYDIETDKFEIGRGKIIMISLVAKNFKKVLTWKKCPHNLDFVECYKDEAEMLEAFVDYIQKENIDVLAGYFSDNFDLPYLRARAEKNGIKLSIGLDGSQPKLSKGNAISARIDGIVHIDLFKFIKTNYSQYLQSETLSLNEVASELIGEKKLEWKHKHSSKIEKDEWIKYFEYNLQDSVLVYKLMEKSWPDIMEFSKIIREPLFNVSRESMSVHVENYIIHNLEKFDEIAEKRPLNDEILKRRMLGKYEGAFVFQPQPGLYEDIAFFDFTSMYSSVIVTYNLSLSTFLEKKEINSTEVFLSENHKVYFAKEKGFFPVMLEEIIKKRKQYKKEYKENQNAILKARSNAFKLLANASYGYLGFFGARYYCREAAASTAALARKSILETIEKIKKKGYKVIYSDTDSIAFLVNKTQKKIIEMLKELNSELPGIMELDLEGFYKRGIWVSKRTTTEGAKKKYALIDEDGKIKVRGFETVRRDWCRLAKKVQNEIISLILKNGNEKKALEYFNEIVKKVNKKEIENDDLIIKTQLKKEISSYAVSIPHVVVAKRMLEAGLPVRIGTLIEYIVVEDKQKNMKRGKPGLVRERAELPDRVAQGEYDVEYYLNNQLIPAVENIFEVFNVDVKSLKDGKTQKKISEF